ncbi:Uncharacterised protein [Actinomyces viscosus]|uniref:Restriction endonuclease type IV Mrr domain-containing protein n=2 Tax=Actinomyces viscosus TaxID=1656 RepID=A0A3S4VJK6_ACTVI|nr:Uncharacterised protein [Actinomyces viscosus]
MDRMVDTGVHVVASRAVAQVRISPSVATAEDLKRLVDDSQMRPGCYRIAFSVAGFSGEAMRFAEECGIGLLVLRPDGSAIPVNAWGENLAGVRPASAPLMAAPAPLAPMPAPAVPARRSFWRHPMTWYVIAIMMLGTAITGVSRIFTEGDVGASIGTLVICLLLAYVSFRYAQKLGRQARW